MKKYQGGNLYGPGGVPMPPRPRQKNEEIVERMTRRSIFVVMALQMLTACGDESTYWPEKRFSRTEWVATKDESRYIYARDLVESMKLVGLSREQVIELLGMPSYDDPNKDYMVYVVKNGPRVYGVDTRFSKNSSIRLVYAAFIRSD